MTTLNKQRGILDESDIVLDSPNETVLDLEPTVFINCWIFFYYKEVKQILESDKCNCKIFIPTISTFLAELRKKNLYLAFTMVGHWYLRNARLILTKGPF